MMQEKHRGNSTGVFDERMNGARNAYVRYMQKMQAFNACVTRGRVRPRETAGSNVDIALLAN